MAFSTVYEGRVCQSPLSYLSNVSMCILQEYALLLEAVSPSLNLSVVYTSLIAVNGC